MDRVGHQLLPLAGPNFPPAVTAALAPWRVGSKRGCCGTAAFTGEQVIISDLSTDPRWPKDDEGEAERRLVLDQGLRAAWSEPLISNSGEVLGTFCIGYSQPRTPTSLDFAVDRGCWTYSPHRYRTTPVARSSHCGARGNQGLRDQSSAGDRYHSHTRLVQYARGP